MLIIGITGTLGAGKGTIVDYLVETRGFSHYSARNFIVNEVKARGLDVNRDTMTIVANDLRAKHSPSFIIEKLYEQAYEAGKNCIIESVRTPAEVEALKNQGNFYLFSIDANANRRYERIVLRNSETDKISFDTFIANEEREMNSTDPNAQNISKCIEKADFKFLNDNAIEDLQLQVEKVINQLCSNI